MQHNDFMPNEFITHHTVRMHDTDMAGIIFFASQFRFAHDAWEDLMAEMGFDFDTLFTKETFAFVIVHAEADYLKSLKAGDNLKIAVAIERIGETSFTVYYKIYKSDELVGTARTVHVTVDRASRKKIAIPKRLKSSLEKHAALRT